MVVKSANAQVLIRVITLGKQGSAEGGITTGGIQLKFVDQHAASTVRRGMRKIAEDAIRASARAPHRSSQRSYPQAQFIMR